MTVMIRDKKTILTKAYKRNERADPRNLRQVTQNGRTKFGNCTRSLEAHLDPRENIGHDVNATMVTTTKIMKAI